jgi:O-antigen ligase
MLLRKPLLAQVLLFLSLLGGFGFLGFYPAVHIREIAEISVLFLFSWLALSTRINSKWFLYVFFPAFGLMIFVLSEAYIFTLRVDSPLLPSVISERDYVLFLLAPIIYMLGIRGWRLADFQRVVVLAILSAMISRIIADLTIGPSLLLSGSFFTLKLDEIYGEQAFLLRRLDLSILFSALYFGRSFLQAKDSFLKGLSFIIMALSCVLLLVSTPRVLLASTVIALVLYGVFLSRPERVRRFAILLPLCALIIVLQVTGLETLFASVFGEDPSYSTRRESAHIAWNVVQKYPLLGMGQDGAEPILYYLGFGQSVSYEGLFGAHYYPTDVGLLGVAFQFGLVGLLLYVAFSAWLVVNLLKLLWTYTGSPNGVNSREKVFLWALFIIALTITFGSLVQARFIKVEGLSIAALSLGLLWSHKRDADGRHRKNVQRSRASEQPRSSAISS